jgi:hypothetical protein
MRRRIAFGLISTLVVVVPAVAAGTGPAEFLLDGGAVIVRRAADGSVVGTVAEHGYGAQWSPDGTRIAFRKEGGREILVAEAGGEPRRIWASGAADTFVQELSWSPDGRSIAFIRLDPAGADVLTVPAAGGSTRRLTTTAGFKSRLAWQPSGRLVAYNWHPDAAVLEALAGTWVVDAETTMSRRIGPRELAVEGGRTAWSPDGTDLALAVPGGVIRVYAADGTLKRAISGLGDAVAAVSWSPDGGRIAFTSWVQFPDLYSRFGTPAIGNLYVVDSDGSNVRRLTGVASDSPCDWRRTTCDGSSETLRAGSAVPRWWPGGNRLFFSRAGQLWTVNADGTCEARLGVAQGISEPVWSPLAPPLPAVDCVSAEVRMRWNRKPGGLRRGAPFSVFVRNDGTQTLSEPVLEISTTRGRVAGVDNGPREYRDGHFLFRLGALAPGAETLVQLRAFGVATPTASVLKAHVFNFVPPLGGSEPESERVQIGFERCDDVGTRRGDRLVGTDQPERICGNGGSDRLFGRAEGDSLNGGEGADTIDGGRGRDVIDTGPGADVVNVRDGERDTVDCGAGTDRVVADELDRLRGCERVVRR